MPNSIHDKVPTDNKPLESSVLPLPRQCRQGPDTPLVALEQHFRHSGRPAKISVDLEGRMGIPQIWQRAALQQQAEEMICMIPIPVRAQTFRRCAMAQPVLLSPRKWSVRLALSSKRGF